MRSYQLTLDAEQDLREIAEYTVRVWGENQLKKYQDGLLKTINQIVESPYSGKLVSKKHPELLAVKHQQHIIFYLVEDPITIIGVIHEKRDVVKHLYQRLE